MPHDTPGFDALFNCSLIVMDGGLGTILEDELGPSVSQSPLWSAHAIASEPQALVQTHLRYLVAGARVISTSTYQCSLETFNRAGFNEEESRCLMLKSVHLANEARSRFQAQAAQNMHGGEQGHHPLSPVFVALSLGPFGATLRPTQEFQAFYPPPYGPCAFTPDGPNKNRFDNSDDERRAIDALAQFHYNRLAVFAADHQTWDYVDCIAFETVPLRREVMAIRKAMGRLQHSLTETHRGCDLKPWWISCVFPNGASPEDAASPGAKIQISELLDAAFEGVNEERPCPPGFGINCTSLKHISTLCMHIEKYFNAIDASPWLILYPNGSDVYDESKQEWIRVGRGAEEWAQELVSFVEMKGVGQRVLVGGCCRTGPKEITALDQSVKSVFSAMPAQ